MPTKNFSCTSCAASIEFSPGTDQMKCPHCGAVNQIIKAEGEILKLVFDDYVEKTDSASETVEMQVIKCPGCGAQSNLPPNLTTGQCPFCATPLIAGDAYKERLIKPQALLPFNIRQRDAQAKFRDWINGLWFAPSALKRTASQEGGLKGVYIPYWIYDCKTHTKYVGKRGVYSEETYDDNGVTRTRRKTDWFPASGEINRDFSDVLVVGSQSLPRNYADKLEPWDIEKLTPYQEEYLSGFTTESYQTDLKTGFEYAKDLLQRSIDAAIEQDIGGDTQQIERKQVTYNDITFKHVLLPIWLSSYRFNNKTYRFLVNARTGEIQGERPLSLLKIVGAITLLLIAIAVFKLVFGQ